MSDLQTVDLELRIRELIVDALNLEEVTAAEIGVDEPLFGEGLGLDSIDALEIGVALRKAFGIKIEGPKEELKKHFANVRSLAAFVRTGREK